MATADKFAAPDGVRVPATDGVAELVAQMITENQMKAGDVLPSEQALSQMFRVSVRVVREGLRILAARGIIQTSQGKRAVVAGASPVAIEAYFRFVEQMDRKSVLELYELREIIEVQAAALAAQRATAEDIARAREALEAMVISGDDVPAYITGDIAFHAAIIDASHNRFLSGVMSALSGALYTERELGVRNRIRAAKRPKAVREHRAILAAVEAGDSERAERATLIHMASGRADVRRYLSDQLEAEGQGASAQASTGQRAGDELPAAGRRTQGR